MYRKYRKCSENNLKFDEKVKKPKKYFLTSFENIRNFSQCIRNKKKVLFITQKCPKILNFFREKKYFFKKIKNLQKLIIFEITGCCARLYGTHD